MDQDTEAQLKAALPPHFGLQGLLCPPLVPSGGLKELGNHIRPALSLSRALLTSGLLGDLTGDTGEGPEQQLWWNSSAGEL